MKKVIFICLLSLSMCLSNPAGQSEPPAQGQANLPVAPTKNETVTPLVPATNPAVTEAPHAAVTTAPTSAPAANPTKKDIVTPPPTIKNETDGNKTPSDKHTDNVDPNKIPIETTTLKPVSPVTNAHPADDKDKNSATTKVPETTSNKPTDAPSKEGEKVPVQARGFDTGSFVGGIILTLGLLAIGFMGFKYYKNQTERNYHTL